MASPQDLQPRLDGVTVLMVDDVATNRLVAWAHRVNQGSRVLSAVGGGGGGGGEAQVVLAGTAVDLVLLDMNMPDPDGLATFRRLRCGRCPCDVGAPYFGRLAAGAKALQWAGRGQGEGAA